MLEWFSRIFIRSLLVILVIRLRYMVRKSDSVKTHLVGQSRLLIITTRDQAMNIPILFNEFGVEIIKEVQDIKPLVLEFICARKAVSLIFKGDGKLFMKAMQQKELCIKGDLKSLAWYAQLSKKLLPVKK